MEALGPGGDRVSPASSTRNLDRRRLSTRTDSAYSSFSAASSGPEPRTRSPGTDLLPYFDWAYVRVVWGGPAPARPDAVPRTSPRPQPAVAARTGLHLPARLRPAAPARPPTAHPRSASLSHPGGEVRPERSQAPAPGTAGRGRLANQQRKWCFSEPGELDRVGRGGGPAGDGSGEASSSSSLARREPQELQHRVLADSQGHQIGWLPDPQTTADLDFGSLKLSDDYRPASGSPSASSEVLGPWRGPGGAVSIIQAVPQGAENPRQLFQTRLSRFLTQKETAAMCTAEVPHSSPSDCEQSVSETHIVSARLPSLPDDEVFLEESVMVRMGSSPDSCAPQRLPTSVHASDQQYETGLDQGASQATVPQEHTLYECPGTTGADDCWQEVNGSVGVSKPTHCSPPRTANGDIPTIDPTGLLTTDPPTAAESDPLKPLPADALGPSGNNTRRAPHHTVLAWGTGQPGSRPTWPTQHLEELVQELARLDPCLSDTLASHPSPEPPVGLLDGLIPLAEVWAAMKPACGEAGEEAAGISETGSYQSSFIQLLPTSQEETRLENPATHPVPDPSCGQGLPAPNNSIQSKKVELAGLLQKMLWDLQGEQERLRGAAQAWARRRAALEAAVGQACTPRELERFSRFMADLERVLGLLLLLGSRLARVRCALARAGSDGDPDERTSLLQRLGLLQRQQEDAKELKEHVARRERALREVLSRALPAEELRSYCALLAGKAAVLAQQRSLDDRVRLLQDQLDAVRSNLGHRPLSPRPVWPPGTCRDEAPFPPSLI
ncbi:PREDICTED: protein Shroom1 [Galeopterus variegatus]|uniref:Protein Shroom1 n=1 Tax=Galeopterus variegatus TaxID=482537 RepID=A0ABM0QND3_GALVR|nr:PREDICTED: protein Shroom1 [Galeopterus variegatus]